ncbi:putative acyl-CoA:6-aminopenicillanic-acid-acyltransferase [Xylariales sp. PMI_506]|nr:putative acyl-CoA:6-aminopenicillanic-acid-acyltransferase [Xylariales sp. PMI_506]
MSRIALPRQCCLRGTPKEIGFQHGQQLSAEIAGQIKIYEDVFKLNCKLDWPTVREIAEPYRATIQKLTPNIYEEIEGIADGSGRNILDIVAINCRSEIAMGMFSDGCTSLGWKTSDTRIILAQNWDWTTLVQQNCALLTIEQPGNPTIYMMTEAGMVGKIGFNSSSVGVCQNAIRARPTDSSKVPYHVACRVMLNSTSASNALENLKSLGGVASTQHVLLADVASGPISCELSPRGDAYIYPNEQGMVCHTNHLIANKLVDESSDWLGGSEVRLRRAYELAGSLKLEAQDAQKIDADALRTKIFSDTYNTPSSICAPGNPARPIAVRSSTLMCIVMKFEKDQEPSAEVVWGQPGSGTESEVLQLP